MKIEDKEIVEININEKYKELVPEISDDKYTNLKSDIEKYGILNPITLNENNEIIDGHNRYKIAKELKFEIVPTIIREYKNEFEEQREVISLNLNRRQLKKEDLIGIAEKLLPIEEELAKLRHEATLPKKGDKGTSKLEGHSKKGEATEFVADITGLGRSTVAKIKKISEAAKNDPEITKRWEIAKENGVSVDAFYKELFPPKTVETKKGEDISPETKIDGKEIVLQRRTYDKLYYIMDNVFRKKEGKEVLEDLDQVINYVINKSKLIEDYKEKSYKDDTKN